MRRLALLTIMGLTTSLMALGCAGVCGEDLLQCRGRCEAYKECKARGCQQSQQLAYIRDCRSLGVAWSDGVNGRRDEEKAVEYYKLACDGGDGLGCSYLGLMYEDGRGVRRNTQKAVVLYKKGCADSVTIACLGLERLQTSEQ